MVRIGTVFFGLCYVAFLVLELITVLEVKPGSLCYNPVRAAACILNILFVLLQGTLIVLYPRLNLNINRIIDRYGHKFSTRFFIFQEFNSAPDSGA